VIPEPQEQEEFKLQKKKPWRWIILGLILIILAGGFYLSTVIWDNDSEEKEDLKGIKKITLASFTVNLKDSLGQRYLRTTITMEFKSKELEKELEFSQHRVKDVVLEVLRAKRASDIDSPEETDLLRKELLAAVNSTVINDEIIGLYFEEFIIQ